MDNDVSTFHDRALEHEIRHEPLTNNQVDISVEARDMLGKEGLSLKDWGVCVANKEDECARWDTVSYTLNNDMEGNEIKRKTNRPISASVSVLRDGSRSESEPVKTIILVAVRNSDGSLMLSEFSVGKLNHVTLLHRHSFYS